MNYINSCIVEGKIAGFTKNLEWIEVILKVSRYTKNEKGKPVESFAELPCRITGGFMNFFERYAKINKKMRIVGRLSGTEKLIVFAEHIEFKI